MDAVEYGSDAVLSVKLPWSVLTHHRHAANTRLPSLQIRASGAVALVGSTRPEDLEAMLWRISPLLLRARE